MIDGERPQAAARARDRLRTHQEDLLDSALEQTFPASDPVSPPRFT